MEKIFVLIFLSRTKIEGMRKITQRINPRVHSVADPHRVMSHVSICGRYFHARYVSGKQERVAIKRVKVVLNYMQTNASNVQPIDVVFGIQARSEITGINLVNSTQFRLDRTHLPSRD
jgi:hypothetical protein